MLGGLLGLGRDWAVGRCAGWLLVQERGDVLAVQTGPQRVTQQVGDGRALVQERSGVPLRLGQVEGTVEGSQGLVGALTGTVAAATCGEPQRDGSLDEGVDDGACSSPSFGMGQ